MICVVAWLEETALTERNAQRQKIFRTHDVAVRARLFSCAEALAGDHKGRAVEIARHGDNADVCGLSHVAQSSQVREGAIEELGHCCVVGISNSRKGDGSGEHAFCMEP